MLGFEDSAQPTSERLESVEGFWGVLTLSGVTLMRRLHIQFYLAILATLAVFIAASVLFWSLAGSWRAEAWGRNAVEQLVAVLLPPAASTAEQQRVIDDLSLRLNMDLALYDARGQLLAAQGDVPPSPPDRHHWTRTREGRMWVVTLADGRRLAVRPRDVPHGVGAWRLLSGPLLFVLACVLGAYPIARRLTRRLGRLQAGVEQLGQGNLGTRVAVEGRDEVAALARSFNRSAERIEELVRSHKLLLANCSHELRTPLARIRLGLERISRGGDPELQAEIARSIGELDTLIGEMLLSSRLDAQQSLEHAEEVDLLALAAEEAAHLDRTVEGQPALVRGDPALLRRLLRNLLDNAERHAGGATRIAVNTNAHGQVELLIEDRGNGVPVSEHEKIFEPFHRSPSSRGFGLGLALVRQIARAHGGEVRFVARPEGGACFIVTLPSQR